MPHRGWPSAVQPFPWRHHPTPAQQLISHRPGSHPLTANTGAVADPTLVKAPVTTAMDWRWGGITVSSTQLFCRQNCIIRQISQGPRGLQRPRGDVLRATAGCGIFPMSRCPHQPMDSGSGSHPARWPPGSLRRGSISPSLCSPIARSPIARASTCSPVEPWTNTARLHSPATWSCHHG